MQDFLKIAFVLLTAPIWLPFVKAMKRELFDLFEEDGGLFGDDPGPVGRAAIRARRVSRPAVLVHEWLAHVRAAGGQSVGSAPQLDQGSPTQRAGRGEPGLRPRPIAGQMGRQLRGQPTPETARRAAQPGRPGDGGDPQRRSFR